MEFQTDADDEYNYLRAPSQTIVVNQWKNSLTSHHRQRGWKHLDSRSIIPQIKYPTWSVGRFRLHNAGIPRPTDYSFIRKGNVIAVVEGEEVQKQRTGGHDDDDDNIISQVNKFPVTFPGKCAFNIS